MSSCVLPAALSLTDTQLASLYNYLFSYVGMGAVGLIVCIAVAPLLCRAARVSPLRFFPACLAGALPVYLGAKLFGILSLAAYRLHAGLPLDFTVVQNAGIVYYGGLLAFIPYAHFVFRRVFPGEQASLALDIAALLIPLFHSFARVGCYFAGCCYGVTAESAFFSAFRNGRVPVQLMEACFEMLLFIALCLLFFRSRAPRPHLLRIYLFCYALFRFIIEFWRGDVLRGFIGPLSFSQWISLPVLFALPLLYGIRKKASRTVKEVVRYENHLG